MPVQPVIPFATAFLNRKGGCGKTSCVFHLGGALAAQGHNTLMIDMDPQASLSQGILGPERVEQFGTPLFRDESVYGLFGDNEVKTRRFILGTGVDNLYLLPGSHAMESKNHALDSGRLGRIQLCLSEFVREEALLEYDLVLIDCPPTLGLCSWAAMLAAHHVVVPVQPEDYGAQGIVYIQRFIEDARQRYNKDLELLGYLLTMYQSRLGVHKLYAQDLRDRYGTQVFLTAMPYATHFKESITARQPVGQYAPKTTAARAMRKIAEEMLVRAKLLAEEDLLPIPIPGIPELLGGEPLPRLMLGGMEA